MGEAENRDRVVNVHTAGTIAEAMVIRSLLESAGIYSPDPLVGDPFPLREPPEGTHGVEIFVLESQAGQAEQIIKDYLNSDETLETEEEETPGGSESESESAEAEAADPPDPEEE